MTRYVIVTPKAGIAAADTHVRAVYSNETAAALQTLGDIELRRASHVEPGSELQLSALLYLVLKSPNVFAAITPTPVLLPGMLLKWWADLMPVKGPVLGPYDTREQALTAETDYLFQHNIPIAK